MPKIRRCRAFEQGRDDVRVATDRGVVSVNLERIPTRLDRRNKRCYQLAGVFQQDNPEWVLVHADTLPPTGPYAGTTFDHAFVERDGVVFDPIFAEFYPVQEFYAVYGVTNARRFDHDTAVHLLLKENHWGPWGDPHA